MHEQILITVEHNRIYNRIQNIVSSVVRPTERRYGLHASVHSVIRQLDCCPANAHVANREGDAKSAESILHEQRSYYTNREHTSRTESILHEQRAYYTIREHTTRTESILHEQRAYYTKTLLQIGQQFQGPSWQCCTIMILYNTVEFYFPRKLSRVCLCYPIPTGLKRKLDGECSPETSINLQRHISENPC
jgi:hypothetical protein